MKVLKEDKYAKKKFRQLRESLSMLGFGTNIKKHNKTPIFLIYKTIDSKKAVFEKKTIEVGIDIDNEFKKMSIEAQKNAIVQLWEDRGKEYQKLKKNK